MTLTAYNAGEGAVLRQRDGLPVRGETLDYVAKIRRSYPMTHHPVPDAAVPRGLLTVYRPTAPRFSGQAGRHRNAGASQRLGQTHATRRHHLPRPRPIVMVVTGIPVIRKP